MDKVELGQGVATGSSRSRKGQCPASEGMVWGERWGERSVDWVKCPREPRKKEDQVVVEFPRERYGALQEDPSVWVEGKVTKTCSTVAEAQRGRR